MKFSESLTKLLILTLSLLVVFLTYKSLKINSTISTKYMIYIIFLISLILIFSIIFFFKKDIINEALIVFFSILISLYFIQCFSTYKNLKKVWLFNKKNEVKYDLRSYNEVLKSGNFFPRISSDYFVNDVSNIFPLGTISNRKILACNENGYFSHYNSDRFGFNNPDQNWDKKNIDYLVLGDSYMEGDCVFYRDTLMGNLKNLNKKKNIISLARGGTGTLFQYAALKEYAQTKSVKNVLLFFYEGNDLGNIENEMKNKVLLNYLDQEYSQNLIYKQNLIDEIILSKSKKLNIETQTGNFYIHEFSKFIKLKIIRDLIRNYFIFYQGKYNSGLGQFSIVLDELKEFCFLNNIKLHIIYLPNYARYRGIKDKEDFLKYKKIKDLIKKKKIIFLDFAEHLEKQDQPLENWPFEYHGHLNKKGYKELANFVNEFIDE